MKTSWICFETRIQIFSVQSQAFRWDQELPSLNLVLWGKKRDQANSLKSLIHHRHRRMVVWACAVVVGGFGANLWKTISYREAGGAFYHHHFSLNCDVRAVSHSCNVWETYFQHSQFDSSQHVFIVKFVVEYFSNFSFHCAAYNIMSNPKPNTFPFDFTHSTFSHIYLINTFAHFRQWGVKVLRSKLCCKINVCYSKCKRWKCYRKYSCCWVHPKYLGKTVRSSLELSAESFLFCLFYFAIQLYPNPSLVGFLNTLWAHASQCDNWENL